MSYTREQFIADQLKAGAPDAEWNASNVDRAMELARIFSRNGIIDLTKLQIIRNSVTINDIRALTDDFQPTTRSETIEGLSLLYEGKIFGFLGTPDRSDNGSVVSFEENFIGSDGREQRFELVEAPFLEGLSVAWSAEGHGNVTYRLTIIGGGAAFIPVWASSSDLDYIRNAALMTGIFVVSIVMPAMGVNAAAAVGSAVVSPAFAAAYPAITAGIGHVALATAFNGGDVEAAVKTALVSAGAGEVGAFVGGQVAGATDIEALGKVTAAATQAYISGGDVNKAVAVALFQAGAVYGNDAAPVLKENEIMDDISNYGPFLPEYGGYQFDPVFLSEQTWFQNLPYGASYQPAYGDPGAELPFPAAYETLPLATLPEAINPILLAPLPDAMPVSPPVRADNPWSMGDTRNLVQSISQAALVALQFESARRALNPQVNTTARFTNPNTQQITIAAEDGTIQTRDQNGQIVVTRPAVNQPQLTQSGNVVINNGDGTYTVINPSGEKRVVQYAPGASDGGGFFGLNLSNANPAFILGGVGLLVALFRR